MAITQHHRIILASGSTIRQQMLKACGLTFSVEPSGVDETALSATLKHLPTDQHAVALASAKALSVSKTHAGAYVIGADQICCLGDEVFHKPGTYDNAEAQLAKLAGRTHHQHSGVVIAHNNEVIWQHVGIAALTMRALTKDQIRGYVGDDAPLASCGSYKFESLGRHLFTHVEGDHDVIKGLPLLPLLAELHARGIIALEA